MLESKRQSQCRLDSACGSAAFVSSTAEPASESRADEHVPAEAGAMLASPIDMLAHVLETDGVEDRLLEHESAEAEGALGEPTSKWYFAINEVDSSATSRLFNVRVSSKYLILASEVFSALLRPGGFQEGVGRATPILGSTAKGEPLTTDETGCPTTSVDSRLSHY